MQNGHSRSLKVIYFRDTEEPLWDCIAQYNNGLRREGSEDIAGKISENRHFRQPHSHLNPPGQRTPAKIRINYILLETAIPGLHFVADSLGLSSFKFLWWAPKDVCNATERIIAVQGQFRVIQGR